MTLNIAGKNIKVSEVEANNHQAKLAAIALIEEPKISDRKKFLFIIEENLLLLIENKITVKAIEDWIWYSYLVDIKRNYLSMHLRGLKKKFNLIK